MNLRRVVLNRSLQQTQCPRPSGLQNSGNAVPFTDDSGNPVLGIAGNQMQRPAGWDPHFFTFQGATYPTTAALFNFRTSGAWDAQRMGGGYQGGNGAYHADFVDFANVNIGLYASAAGLTENSVLSIANGFASAFSSFGSQARDPTYTSLRPANVYDIELGYKLQQSGAICTPE